MRACPPAPAPPSTTGSLTPPPFRFVYREATLVPSAGLDTALDSYKTLLAFAGRLHDALQPDVALRDVARDVVRRTWKQLRAAHEQ